MHPPIPQFARLEQLLATYFCEYFDEYDNLFVVDQGNHKIKKVTPAGVVTTFAGNGSAGSQDGTGVNAQFNSPSGIAIDSNNNLFISDTQNHRIRKITPSGEVTTYTGSISGYQN